MTGDRLRARAAALGGARDPRPGETRTYTVLDRSGDPTAAPRPVTVVVAAACPRCGKARGEAEPMTVTDAWTQTEHEISAWVNRCGHVDLHVDVLAEADQQRQSA